MVKSQHLNESPGQDALSIVDGPDSLAIMIALLADGPTPAPVVFRSDSKDAKKREVRVRITTVSRIGSNIFTVEGNAWWGDEKTEPESHLSFTGKYNAKHHRGSAILVDTKAIEIDAS